MNKEEIKKKLAELEQKKKEIFKRAKDKKQEETKKKIQGNYSGIANIYDDIKRDAKPTASYSIKPMSQSGQKVSINRFVRNPFTLPKLKISGFISKIIYLISSILSAWLLGLSFAKEAKPLAAFFAFFIIAISLRNIKTKAGSLFYGLLTGFLANIFIFSWIYDTVFAGTANYFLAKAALYSLSLILALPMIIFCYFANNYKKNLWFYPLASASLWVALEFCSQLISYKFFGFPWFVLGYTQYANLTLIQSSSILGVYGVSFFIVFCSFSAAIILGTGVSFKKRFFNLIFTALIVFAFFAYGKKQLTITEGQTKTLKVAIIQPNTHKDLLKEDYSQILTTLNFLREALQQQDKLDLVIWPESTIPGYLEEGPLKEFMAKASLLTHSAQLAGGSDLEKTKEGNLKNYVAAGLYNKGQLIAQHHKRKIVPFGEFLPFKEYLNDFYEKNNIVSLTGSFVAGSGPAKNLTLQKEGIKTLFGAQICFESIFPALWRLETLEGAEFFVNISNDGWFLDTAAPYQHLRINVFRAVENNKPILRSANSGLSAYIDAFGKIIYQSKLDQEEIKIIDLVLPQNKSQTLYTKYGDAFALICLFIAFIFYSICTKKTKKL